MQPRNTARFSPPRLATLIRSTDRPQEVNPKKVAMLRQRIVEQHWLRKGSPWAQVCKPLHSSSARVSLPSSQLEFFGDAPTVSEHPPNLRQLAPSTILPDNKGTKMLARWRTCAAQMAFQLCQTVALHARFSSRRFA